jgi:hypothetical protein
MHLAKRIQAQNGARIEPLKPSGNGQQVAVARHQHLRFVSKRQMLERPIQHVATIWHRGWRFWNPHDFGLMQIIGQQFVLCSAGDQQNLGYTNTRSNSCTVAVLASDTTSPRCQASRNCPAKPPRNISADKLVLVSNTTRTAAHAGGLACLATAFCAAAFLGLADVTS